MANTSSSKNQNISNTGTESYLEPVVLTDKQLHSIAIEWINYLSKHPKKLFIIEHDSPNYRLPLEMIRQSNGFQITAFAGKAQNTNTPPEKLPDLGELNLLARLRVIQLLVKKPIQIILDGEYYTSIFNENLETIKNYEERLKEFGRIAELNKECPSIPTFLTVDQVMESTSWTADMIKEKFSELKKKPEWSFKRLDMYPNDLISSVKNFAPKADEMSNVKILEMAENFIIMKSILSEVLRDRQDIVDYQRITILKYSKTHNPRINMEMNAAPWNSSILFKKGFKNINTATSSPYFNLASDQRNCRIESESGDFLGFTRNPAGFNVIPETEIE